MVVRLGRESRPRRGLEVDEDSSARISYVNSLLDSILRSISFGLLELEWLVCCRAEDEICAGLSAGQRPSVRISVHAFEEN